MRVWEIRLQQRHVRFNIWEIFLRGWVVSTSRSSCEIFVLLWRDSVIFRPWCHILSQCLEPGAIPVISNWSRVHLQVTKTPSPWETHLTHPPLHCLWAARTFPELSGQRSPPDPGGSTANPALHSATICPCCPCPVQLNKWMFFISWPSLNWTHILHLAVICISFSTCSLWYALGHCGVWVFYNNWTGWETRALDRWHFWCCGTDANFCNTN